MGQRRRSYLVGEKVWACRHCRTHLTTSESLMSKKFNGQHGQAYLFHTVVNVNEGPVEDRPMTTGLHTVRDISCAKCDQILGWRYERAFELIQRYKEGKYILERALLIDCTDRRPVSVGSGASLGSSGTGSSGTGEDDEE